MARLSCRCRRAGAGTPSFGRVVAHSPGIPESIRHAGRDLPLHRRWFSAEYRKNRENRTLAEIPHWPSRWQTDCTSTRAAMTATGVFPAAGERWARGSRCFGKRLEQVCLGHFERLFSWRSSSRWRRPRRPRTRPRRKTNRRKESRSGQPDCPRASTGRSTSTRAGAPSASPIRCSTIRRNRAWTRTSATSGSRATSSRRCRAATRSASSSEIYGKVSVVGERTYGSVPAAFGAGRLVVRARGPLDRLAIGQVDCRLGENALDFSDRARAVPPRSRVPAVGRRGRRRQPRRLLDERAQGVRVRRDRPLQAGRPHGRNVLSRQGRARRERQRQPAVGRQLRVQHRRGRRRSARPT